MTTYYYVVASDRFMLQEEPTHEIFTERLRNYQENEKEVDFWLIQQPAFLEQPTFAAINVQVPKPAAAIVSKNKSFIIWLKLRLEFVITGEFQSDEAIDQVVASLVNAA